MDIVDFYLEDLKSKFYKIDPDKYYLSYSGGKDSHLLYWFIKDYAKMNNKVIITGTTNPRLQEIEKLERRYFDLQMCDHWDSSDYRYAEELRDKIKELKGETNDKFKMWRLP